MISEAAIKKLNQKEEFLTEFSKSCGIRSDCLFPRLRVTYDYTKHEEIDAVILTSGKIFLLELVTLSGHYKIDKEKDKWVKEERVESTGGTKSINHTLQTTPDGDSPSQVTVINTTVPNPVLEAKRKLRALKQYIESKMGPRSVSDFEYRVIMMSDLCTLDEECVTTRLVMHSQIDAFTQSFSVRWGWWILEKVVPIWPVWIRRYTELKTILDEVPTMDVVVLKSGTKLFGELRKCSGVPFDRPTISEIQFKPGKTGLVFGSSVIIAQAILMGSGKRMFTQPPQLEPGSELEFVCVDGDGSVQVKVSDVVKVIITRTDT